jgi:hypothetical protein
MLVNVVSTLDFFGGRGGASVLRLRDYGYVVVNIPSTSLWSWLWLPVVCDSTYVRELPYKYHARVCEHLYFQLGGVSLMSPLQGQVLPP